MRTPHLRWSVPARPASLVVAVVTLALGGVFAPAPASVHALEPGPEVSSGRQLPLNPSGPPAYMEMRSITPDYLVYTEPGLANPYEGESFSVRRVVDGSLVTKLPSNMATRTQPLVSGNSVVQAEDSINGTQVTARPLDQKGRTWTVRVPPGSRVQAATQEGVVVTLARGAVGDCAVVLLRDGQDDLVLPMRLTDASGDRVMVTGDGRTMVMSNGSALWALNLVTGDARLLATKNVGYFDRIRMTRNRVFWVDAEWAFPIWQDRVSWVGLDGSPGGNVVVADPGNAGRNTGYIPFGDGLAILHVPAGRSYDQPDLEPLDLATGERQPAVASFVTAAYGLSDGRAVLVTRDLPHGRIVEIRDDGAGPRTIVDLPVNAKVMSQIRLNGGRVDADFGDPHSSKGPIANIAADGTSSTWSNAPKPGLPDIEGGLADVRGDTWLTVSYVSTPYRKATHRLSWPGGQRDVGEYPGLLGRGGQLWASGETLDGKTVVSVYDVRTGLKLASLPTAKTIALDGTTIWQIPAAAGVITGTDAAGARPLQVVSTGLAGCSLLDGQVAGRWALVSCWDDATTWAVDLSGVLVPWKLPAIASPHWDLSLGNGFVTWAQLAHDGAGQEYMQAVVLDLGPGHGQRRYGPLHGTTLPPLPLVAPDDAGAARMVYLDALRQASVVDLDWLTPAPASAAPAKPSRPSASAGNARAQVTWAAPHDGGLAITGYQVTAAPGGMTANTTGAITASITGLTNGAAYTFTVTATNAAGTSPASQASAAVIPKTSPGAPTLLTATAGNAQGLVSWRAPASNGGSPVTGYRVTAAPGGRTVTTTGATTATVTGLSNGASYTFTVTAINAVGTGPASARSGAVTPGFSVQRYITRVYADLFNRAPDPGGLATWTAALNRGTPRVAVANAITYSAEYRSRLIAGSYDRYLGRSPDPGGLRTWLGAMKGGWTISQMESGFIASAEYYSKAGSTDAGWVRKLYADVLSRPTVAPSEVAGWTAQLRAGTGREQVAMGFLLSTERLNTVVDGHYRHLLGRGIDPAGQRTWVGILKAGGRDEAIIGGIIASAEYYGRV